MIPFSGSYHLDDCIFLLKEINMPSTKISDKEKAIQKEGAHYSEMITYEAPPTKQYMDLFYKLLAENEQQFCSDLFKLAYKVNQDTQSLKEVVLVSLARAGTPIGVLISRILKHYFSREVFHYSISIIRDKGIDENALNFILSKHHANAVIFLDGWTGKGVIGKQLTHSITKYNEKNNQTNKQTNDEMLNDHLYVVADISGTAYWSATSDDYLIPSAILNATISGLISRTILNEQFISATDYHGCLLYENLKPHDISNWFIEHVLECLASITPDNINLNQLNNQNKDELNQRSNNTLSYFLNKYQLANENYIKPGVGESTRVLLRRVPKEVWIRDLSLSSVQHLIYLAKQKSVPIYVDPKLSYNAVAIIGSVC